MKVITIRESKSGALELWAHGDGTLSLVSYTDGEDGIIRSGIPISYCDLVSVLQEIDKRNLNCGIDEWILD